MDEKVDSLNWKRSCRTRGRKRHYDLSLGMEIVHELAHVRVRSFQNNDPLVGKRVGVDDDLKMGMS